MVGLRVMAVATMACGLAGAQSGGGPREHIMVATPAYDASVSSFYAKALLQTQMVLLQHQIQMTLHVIPNQIVTRARNTLAHGFLHDGAGYTRMLFIDADVVWEPEAVLQLLSHDDYYGRKELVIGSYPVKRYHWDRVREGVGPSDLVNSASLFDRRQKGPLVKVTMAATGFMMLTREALERVEPSVEKYRYPFMGNPNAQVANFFDCRVVGNEYLTEDYAFSDLFIKAGGEIFMDTRIRLKHQGHHLYEPSNEFERESKSDEF
mmetsp:Transcript_21711/g.68055  ORF Transcript_21711/g.68055 Transcript_21711/m.68055 type:complete len:264 (-) Transcript_21711:54-845(-)